ncbi:hypothetical protein XA3_19880 [Xylocopilactobacillus apicola]|uniref:Glycosyltransferase n=1 Tax=Xylocopilactobacillus apicola TaxID=2932184 RepID=A0AAU9DQS0_9LACO|nr:glycosyltransferase family 4 protein [Xylocopilactobacillus apicola]BDR59547.1 hypothetical protein XA3_19880 [Xylocopilactobacillus apicola]
MNIGIFTDTYFPQISGVATSIKTLKDDLEKKGHSVYIFTTTDPNVDKNDYEPDVYRFGSVPFPSFTERRVAIRGLFKAVSIARSLNLDIVHTQTEFSMGYIGKYVAHALKIPALHTYHTMYEDYLHYIMNGHLLHPSGVKQISRAFLYHMTGLICPSQRVMDTMIRYGIKIPMRIIPTGVDLSQYQKPVDDINLRSDYQIPADAKVVLSVSRVAYEKNIGFLLRSFAEIVKKTDNVYLFIVGDGPAIDDLRDQTAALGIENRVVFTGYVLHSKVVAYYQQADVFVSASNTEAQGLTFIESLAAHTQVLAWDNDYDRLLLNDESLGAVFSTEEELVDLMTKYLSQEISISESILNPVLDRISASHFGSEVLEFYLDLIDHFEEEKQEELDEQEASLMRRISSYLKLTRPRNDEDLSNFAVGFYGEGKFRSLILTNFCKQNYPVFATPSEDNVPDTKKITVVSDESQLLDNSNLIFVELASQEKFLDLARKIKKNQILVNLQTMSDFDLSTLRAVETEIEGHVFDGVMIVNDFESVTLLIGGDQDKYEEISPAFEVFTDEAFYLGALGAAQVGNKSLEILRKQIQQGVICALEESHLPDVDLSAILDLLTDTDETHFIRHVGNRKLNENQSDL